MRLELKLNKEIVKADNAKVLKINYPDDVKPLVNYYRY